MTAAELLARVGEAGYRVDVVRGNAHLVPLRRGLAFPPDLFELLKEHRAAVVAHLTPPETCRACGREVAEEDKPHLEDPAHCSNGGHRPYADNDGVRHPGAERCPYKSTDRR